MLKMTGIKLELMTDVDMFQFIAKGMRGGFSYIAHRHGEANNSIFLITTLRNQVSTSCIWTPIIRMVGHEPMLAHRRVQIVDTNANIQISYQR